MIKKIVFSILMVLSGSVFADTYPAMDTNPMYRVYSYPAGTHEYPTPEQACSAETWSGEIFNWDAAHGACKGVRNSDGYTYYSVYLILTHHYSCPSTGTLSGSSCINATACAADQNRNSVTTACQTPPVCSYPAVYDNPSNSCITPPCPGGQSRLPAPDSTCVVNPTCPAILPLCASTAYDCNNGDGTQQHVVKCATICPDGQHMIGKDCVSDKPSVISCPSGFISKDGGCEAAPPVACPAGTRPGKINGESVCVGAGSKTPQTANDPPESHNTGTGTQDGTTTTVQKDAAGNVTGTSTSTTTGTSKIDLNTTGLATESTNKGILNALTEAGTTSTTVTPADTSKLDTAGDTAVSQLNIANPASYFITSFVVLPSSTCQTVPFHYKTMNYDLDPCTKLQAFRDLLGYFLYIITAIFIYQTATRPAGD